MSALWQSLFVALLVFGAAAYSVWVVVFSAHRRLKWLLHLDAWAARRPSLAPWRTMVLAPRIRKAAGSGCAGCAANGMAHVRRR